MVTRSEQPASSIGHLARKVGLLLSIADSNAITTGCAQHLMQTDITLVAAYPKDAVRLNVDTVTRTLPYNMLLPCDLYEPGSLEAVFDTVRTRFERLDFLLHAVAVEPPDDRYGPVTGYSSPGCGNAPDISGNAFIRAAKLAEPLMKTGGTLLALMFHGSERDVPHDEPIYPVKVALESSVRKLAAELEPKHIRVHAISVGPIRTPAAGGTGRHDAILARAAAEVPESELISINDVGFLTSFLVSDAAKMITGAVFPVDGGQNLPA